MPSVEAAKANGSTIVPNSIAVQASKVMDSCIETGLGAKSFKFKDKTTMYSVKGSTLRIFVAFVVFMGILLGGGYLVKQNKAAMFKAMARTVGHESFNEMYQLGMKVRASVTTVKENDMKMSMLFQDLKTRQQSALAELRSAMSQYSCNPEIQNDEQGRD